MKKLIARPGSIALVAVLALIASMCTVSTAHAASPGGSVTVTSSAASHPASATGTACNFTPATMCKSTNPYVTLNVHYYEDQSGCTYTWNVDWGDGNSTTGLTFTDPADGNGFLAFHAYTATPQTFTISASGQATGGCTANNFSVQFKLVAPSNIVDQFITWLSACLDGQLAQIDPGCKQAADDLAGLGLDPASIVSCAKALPNLVGVGICLGEKAAYAVYLAWKWWKSHGKPGP
jgi:hypothetical protein